jgi:Outer membrane protein beta-barrel domain
MLKKIFIFFLLSLPIATFAQLSINRVKFGIQASPTLGWMRTDDNTIKGNGTNLGLKLGVTTDYYFAENYAFTSGLGFSLNQGGKIIHETGGNFLPSSKLSDDRLNKKDTKSLQDNVSIRYHIQYIEIPFGMKFRTQQFGHLRYFAEAPIFTAGIASQVRGDIYNSGLGENYLKEDIKADTRKLAFSWGFGAGVNYDISTTTSAVVGLYYQKGMVDVTKNSGAYKSVNTATPNVYTKESESSKATIGTLTLHLGIIF